MLIIIIFAVCISYQGFSQVELLITRNDGKLILGDFKSKTADSLTILASKKEITMSYNEIKRVQTFGVHFLQDAYTNELSGNSKAIEFDKFASYRAWLVFISARYINSHIFLLFKFKWNIESDPEEWPVINDNDTILLILSNGALLNLYVNNTYVLHSFEFYNFGYIPLDESNIRQLVNSPIRTMTLKGRKSSISDKYLIMRQLFAIFDEDLQWRYILN